MNITVIGTGYVGLVTGACFAEMGNEVTCVDIDKEKLEKLKDGVLPIYEPGLERVVSDNFKANRLRFTTSLQEAMSDSDIFFIAVGTPSGGDGSADLTYVLDVARQIGQNLERSALIVDKSTVPVGTADKVSATIGQELKKRGVDIEFDVVSNPEFLKEGAAVEDFMRPDRIVVGGGNARSRELMTELYAPFNRSNQRLIFMGIRDAEMTKYAANAMLATKISFMNEIANLCERLDVDVENVRLGIGSDQRIGFHFIYPGAGYGGSCFPKDVKALVQMGVQTGFDTTLLQAVEARNTAQKNRLLEKIKQRYGDDLRGKVFAVWGLAFKPGTDDMRDAPSTPLIDGLLAAGAAVKAHDPVANKTAMHEHSGSQLEAGKLEFVEDQYETAIQADALILVTEWKPFRNPNFKILRHLLKAPVIFDGRNQYDLQQVTREGFEYQGMGRKNRVDA